MMKKTQSMDRRRHAQVKLGLCLSVALALGFGGCMDEVDPEIEEDSLAIQDKEVILMKPGQVDPLVRDDLFAPADEEPVATPRMNVDFTFNKPCLKDSDCRGICWDYRPTTNGEMGRCQAIQCENDNECPTEESCFGGFCKTQCSQHTDCQAGQRCDNAFCRNLERYDFSYCVAGDCGRDEGDCDRDSDCGGDLLCVNNVGANYNVDPRVDVCELPVGHINYCSFGRPCSSGEGDCDNHSECEGTLNFCINNIGAHYGMPSWVDICIGG